MEAHKELVAPKARPQAGAPARRTRAVAPKALKAAVPPEMPTEKPRTPKAGTYQGLLAQMAAVDAQIEKLRAEVPGVVEKIQRLMRDYDLSIDDIAIKRRGRSIGTETTQPKAALPAKYLNPRPGRHGPVAAERRLGSEKSQSGLWLQQSDWRKGRVERRRLPHCFPCWRTHT